MVTECTLFVFVRDLLGSGTIRLGSLTDAGTNIINNATSSSTILRAVPTEKDHSVLCWLHVCRFVRDEFTLPGRFIQ